MALWHSARWLLLSLCWQYVNGPQQKVGKKSSENRKNIKTALIERIAVETIGEEYVHAQNFRELKLKFLHEEKSPGGDGVAELLRSSSWNWESTFIKRGRIRSVLPHSASASRAKNRLQSVTEAHTPWGSIYYLWVSNLADIIPKIIRIRITPVWWIKLKTKVRHFLLSTSSVVAEKGCLLKNDAKTKSFNQPQFLQQVQGLN